MQFKISFTKRWCSTEKVLEVIVEVSEIFSSGFALCFLVFSFDFTYNRYDVFKVMCNLVFARLFFMQVTKCKFDPIWLVADQE